MITSIFLSIAFFIISFLLSIFPTSTGFSSEVTTAINQIGGYTAIIDTLVPMNTLGQIFLLVIVFELTVFAWKGLRFIISYMPIIGGRG